MKRRTFLQRFGSILTALGVTETEWLSLGNHYYQALAQPSTRKFALLVGINQYPQSPALSGCVTDVELQKELLMYRFGFQPSDILCLLNEQAPREFIENAFLEHLVKVARPSDVVFFHFSGYGSRVKLETSQETVQNALVPFDGNNGAQDKKIVNYLLEETLLLMLRSLRSDHVTAVLDTSYYAATNVLPTGLRSRSRPMSEEAVLTTAELEFQKQLKTNNSLSTVLLATSDPQQLAREVLLSGFSAGLFTYGLTQFLWEATPATTIQVCLSRVGSSVQQLGSTKQQPAIFTGENNMDIFLPDLTRGAEGVVTGTEEDGKIALLWLAGLPLPVLEYYGVNSRLTLVTLEGSRAQLVLRSRTGLTAKAQIYNPDGTTSLQVGQLVQEAVRVFTRNINLIVALDTGLERIERVDATSGFATFSHVLSVVAGEQVADYVFGKLPATTSKVVSPSRYGLFSLGNELIPNATGEAGEAVKVAVQRLGSKLQALLAAKLWRLTENQGSSRLRVRATLELIDTLPYQILMQRETVRVKQEESKRLPDSSPEGIPTVHIGSRIQYRVENMSDRPVYLMLLGLNSSRTAIALYPWQTSTQPNSSQTQSQLKDIAIAPGETITAPQTTTGFEWVVQEPASLSETQLIFSTAPFTQTLTALAAAKQPTAAQHRIQPLSAPVEVAQAVLQDLHNASAVKAEINTTSTDSYTLDVNNWASLSFIYQVV
ncbi:MAG: caspase family protein [Stigonema ocellatum SAG 48.90 = DSM 106950]|nr:caspase family protein [Stigonema ocellatum SAG 48.90 = DSM 106950]